MGNIFPLDSWKAVGFIHSLFITCLLWALAILVLVYPQSAPAEGRVSLDDRVSVSFSGLRFNRRTATFDTLGRVHNVSTQSLPGPLWLVVGHMPDSVGLTNAIGQTADGQKFVEVPLAGTGLSPGEVSEAVVLRFSNPDRKRFRFDASVWASLVGVSAPLIRPGALSLGESSEVVFGLRVSQQGDAPVQLVELIELGNRLAPVVLRDDGLGDDLLAGDGLYRGRTAIDPSALGLAPEQCLAFEARVMTTREVVVSEETTLCVTGFAVGIAPSNLNQENLVEDPAGGSARLIADELLVKFLGTVGEGLVSEDRIRSIFGGADCAQPGVIGEIKGTIPGLGIYQLRLCEPVGNAAVLRALVAQLESHPEILYAEPNVLGSASQGGACAVLVPPPQSSGADCSGSLAGQGEDTCLSEQGGLTRIGVVASAGSGLPDAWRVASGSGVKIAVIDDGVDVVHPDLAGWVTTSSPGTVCSHGTHVAGIAGASTWNSRGIAGVARGSTLVHLHTDFTASSMSDAIDAAHADGAQVINVSGGTDTHSWNASGTVKSVCQAVDRAKDVALVVAAVGNYTSATQETDKQYPAACSTLNSFQTPNLIAVGATNLTGVEGRLVPSGGMVGSRHGTWVDLAAPGEAILSTLPSAGYGKLTGTSQAAPMVSGAAALLLSQGVGLLEVESRLTANGQAINFVEKDVPRINVLNALCPTGNSYPLPSLLGLSEGSARALLLAGCLLVDTQEQASADPAGTVIGVNDPGGSGRFRTVTIILSSGTVPPVNVPNVQGQLLVSATAVLESAGLQVGAVTQAVSSTLSAGRVISQDPGAGTLVSTGSGIDLVVSVANHSPTGTVTVIGEPRVGELLTVGASTVADADGLGPFNYQWQRNGVNISGATNSNYTLGLVDVGADIQILVSYVDGQGTLEQLTSAAVGPVQPEQSSSSVCDTCAILTVSGFDAVMNGAYTCSDSGSQSPIWSRSSQISAGEGAFSTAVTFNDGEDRWDLLYGDPGRPALCSESAFDRGPDVCTPWREWRGSSLQFPSVDGALLTCQGSTCGVLTLSGFETQAQINSDYNLRSDSLGQPILQNGQPVWDSNAHSVVFGHFTSGFWEVITNVPDNIRAFCDDAAAGPSSDPGQCTGIWQEWRGPVSGYVPVVGTQFTCNNIP